MSENTSLWEIISDKAVFPALNEDIEIDVVIIGAGITGMTTALHLTESGKKVAVIEAEEIGGVTTGRSTGNLYVAVQPYYQNIISKFNYETAKAVAQSRLLAIDYIEKTVKEKEIHCQFSRRPWYIYTNLDDKIGMLTKEIEILKKMELPLSVNFTDHLPLPFNFKKAAIMEEQARLNPLQYVINIAKYLKKKGCLIFANTRITEINDKTICILKSEMGHKITAKKVIIATHTPAGINPAQFYIAPYRSYVVAVKNSNAYPEAHLWNLDSPIHSICTHAMSDKNVPEILMVAGSHHKVGQDHDAMINYKNLKKFLADQFPDSKPVYQWSAQHYQSADNVPYIGLASRFSKNCYIATGYFADGLVYGTLAGLLIGDLILEKPNPFKKFYWSNRFKPFASLPFLIKEDGNVLMQYYKDLPQREIDFQNIKAGEGKIVEVNREKCAIFKDENEKLHAVSAVCTHMKCIVGWNNAEKTWDCPCHGSRFDTDGKVIEGPATVDLEKKEL